MINPEFEAVYAEAKVCGMVQESQKALYQIFFEAGSKTERGKILEKVEA